ncbi:MAG: tetratricopeptide repeat protein [Ignavibacteriaceae bacterium]
MSLKIAILDKVLKNFFEAEEISELDKILSGDVSEEKIHLAQSRKAQIDTKTGSSKQYYLQIYLLIDFAKNRMSKFKFAELLVYIGEVLIAQGEFNLATEVYSNVLKIARTEPDLENLQAYSLLALGDVSSRQAQWKESISYIRRAKMIFEKEKDYKGCARCENILGTIYGDKSDIKKTRFHFEKSLSYLNPKKDSSLIGIVEINLGIIESVQGNQNAALTYYKRALVKFEQSKDFRRIGELRNNLGTFFINKGDYNSALKEFDISISFYPMAKFLPTLAISYLCKAFIYTKLKDYQLANAFAQKSMDICLKINDRISIAELYKTKGIIEREQNNYKLAKKHFLTSLRINKELDNVMNQAETYFEMGLLYQVIGNKTAAINSWEKSLRYYIKINNTKMAAKIKSFIKSGKS